PPRHRRSASPPPTSSPAATAPGEYPTTTCTPPSDGSCFPTNWWASTPRRSSPTRPRAPPSPATWPARIRKSPENQGFSTTVRTRGASGPFETVGHHLAVVGEHVEGVAIGDHGGRQAAAVHLVAADEAAIHRGKHMEVALGIPHHHLAADEGGGRQGAVGQLVGAPQYLAAVGP